MTWNQLFIQVDMLTAVTSSGHSFGRFQCYVQWKALSSSLHLNTLTSSCRIEMNLCFGIISNRYVTQTENTHLPAPTHTHTHTHTHTRIHAHTHTVGWGMLLKLLFHVCIEPNHTYFYFEDRHACVQVLCVQFFFKVGQWIFCYGCLCFWVIVCLFVLDMSAKKYTSRFPEHNTHSLPIHSSSPPFY